MRIALLLLLAAASDASLLRGVTKDAAKQKQRKLTGGSGTGGDGPCGVSSKVDLAIWGMTLEDLETMTGCMDADRTEADVPCWIINGEAVDYDGEGGQWDVGCTNEDDCPTNELCVIFTHIGSACTLYEDIGNGNNIADMPLQDYQVKKTCTGSGGGSTIAP